MINKKNLWFLTLFSLVLVLSIYYVTMPGEVLTKEISEENDILDNTTVNIEEESVVTSLNVEDDAEVLSKMNNLKEILMNKSTTSEDKNSAFEQLKEINKNSSKEETLELKIKEMCDCNNFVKVDGDNVRVVLESDNSSVSFANEVMRTVQNEFDNKMYISVKFN